MKKIYILTAIAMTLLLFSCNSKKNNVSPSIDLANMDTTVLPGNNFYKYVNGGWLKNHPMPSEYSRYGSFDILQEQNDKKVHDLVEILTKQEHTNGSIGQKVGDFYLSGMDSASIEKDGISPIKSELEKIQKASTISDIQNLIAYFHSCGINPLFNFYGEPDSKNSEMVISSLGQGGLGLGDRDYYIAQDDRSKDIRTAFVKHIAKMFSLAGYNNVAEDNAKKVMELETQLANASKTRVELRDPVKNYNKIKLADVQTLSPEFDWTSYFKIIGLPNPGDINVGQPLFFKEVSKMFKDIPVDQWKAYLTWNLINDMAPYLSSSFVNENFDFYGKTLSGRKALRPRWRRVISTTDAVMGEALGQMYVEKYFPASAKERMLKLVENLRIALKERISKLTWMGDSTKMKAQEKLAAITVKIGYPDKWRDYSKYNVEKGKYALNVLNGKKFEYEYELSQINKPVDHTRWDMTPQTVNAYYNPSNNEICFPAGILQPPFFFPDADDAVNYGAIGVVIGHEITHGFDDQGRMYDKKGNLNEWWTAEDAKHFAEHADMLADRFSSFTVLKDLHANGRLTLGENIADLGGLKISFTAMKNALKEKPAPEKIDGFTPEQRFFIAFAHVWAQHITDQEINRRTKEDPHSIGLYRVNGPLPNLPEFLEAFKIKSGDSLYLPENKRIVIW